MNSSADELALWQDPITPKERVHHELLFFSQGPVDGHLSGDRARDLFLHSRLSLRVLSQIWNLADITNDNVLSVEEFVLAMHLILKVKSGLPVPHVLPKHLHPTAIKMCDLSETSNREKLAYQNVFKKVTQDYIDAVNGRQLMLESLLSVEELSKVWDLSDVDRDGQFNQSEWSLACHLMRHLKQGGKLTGPVNVFKVIPECLSPVSYQARKLRVEDYNSKKHQLIAAKAKRKTQIDLETRRHELIKKRFALHKELVECSKSNNGLTISDEEYLLYKEKEDSNIDKVEAIIYRLKKEYENVRQETVKAILSEKEGPLEDARLMKLEQEDVRQKLSTSHTKATKDPDPFHQLYEQRTDLRKRSTLSEGEEPEVYFSFKTNPFQSTESLHPEFSGSSIFMSPNPQIFKNKNSQNERLIAKDLYGFGDGFIEQWSEDNPPKDPDYDPVFISIHVPMESRTWPGLEWGKASNNDNVKAIHQKLEELKVEMEKLNDDAAGQLLFRNPEDYLAHHKVENTDRIEKRKYQHHYHSNKQFSDKNITSRQSCVQKQNDKTQETARELRLNRYSLNIDHTDIPIASRRLKKDSSCETKTGISFDSPTSASAISVRAVEQSDEAPGVTTSPSDHPSSTSPSTKQRVTPSPPCSNIAVNSYFVQSSNASVLPPISHLKPQESRNIESSNSEEVTDLNLMVTTDDNHVNPLEYDVQHNKPSRRKKSDENKSFIHDNIQKEQRRKSKESAVNVDIIESDVNNIFAHESVTVKSSGTNVPKSNVYCFPEPDSINSKQLGNEYHYSFKELPSLKDKETISANDNTVTNINENIPIEIEPQVINRKSKTLCISGNKEREPESVDIKKNDSDYKKLMFHCPKVSGEGKPSLDAPDAGIHNRQPITFTNNKDEEFELIFEKLSFGGKDKLKDSKDTISILSDISSSGFEAPPLPATAPPTLQCKQVTSLTKLPEDIKSFKTGKVEANPAMEARTTEEKAQRTVGTNDYRMSSNSGSDIPNAAASSKVNGSCIPGKIATSNISTEVSEDSGNIPLMSYGTKVHNTNSNHSEPDYVIDDVPTSLNAKSSKKQNDLCNGKSMEGRQFVLEFDTSKSGDVRSPLNSKDFMVKAQQFADTVQKPPKMTVKLKREITSPDDLTDERYVLLEAERRAVINSSMVKKRSISLDTVPKFNKDSQLGQPDSLEPDTSVPEWQSDLRKCTSIDLVENPYTVSLYSDNVIEETENTESVDRESIANLSSTKQLWESKLQTRDSQTLPQKIKQGPQQVRHWEVKVPAPLKRVTADVMCSHKPESSDLITMADTDAANVSANDLEIHLAIEREELIKKEQEEGTSLQLQQMSSGKETLLIVQNNNKPENTGSTLQQYEESMQKEIKEQDEKEAAVIGENHRSEDSSKSSSSDEDDAANESIIEQEIRLQQERERELEMRRLQLNSTAPQEIQPVQAEIVEETVTAAYNEPLRSLPTPDRRPDDHDVRQDYVPVPNGTRAKISYEDVISNASHEGETLIVRELREAREREEELKKQRDKLTDSGKKSNQPKITEQSSLLKPVISPSTKEIMANHSNERATYQKDVSPYKSDIGQSADSISSEHSTEKNQPVIATKNFKITSSGGKQDKLAYKTSEQPKDKKRQETPIEREIRMSKERENELRIAKGLPPLQDDQKIESKMEEEKDEDVNVSKFSFFSPSYQPQPRDSMQRIASNRLQKEINKQTELEKKYRDEGKIISTSEDHVGLIKYIEIAQQEYTTPPKRNFSIKKPVNDTSSTEQNGTTEQTPSPNINTIEQSTPKKFNRTVSGGGITFSYHESRHKAESKIEQELREMREREDELRTRRSQPGVASPDSPWSPTNISVVDKRSHFEHAL